MQAIDVHREFKICVVTFWVMSQIFNFLGASRGCADFRAPTAVFRIIADGYPIKNVGYDEAEVDDTMKRSGTGEKEWLSPLFVLEAY